jgi:hypothetical protein
MNQTVFAGKHVVAQLLERDAWETVFTIGGCDQHRESITAHVGCSVHCTQHAVATRAAGRLRVRPIAKLCKTSSPLPTEYLDA